MSDCVLTSDCHFTNQNVHVLWLNLNDYLSINDCHDALNRIRQIVNKTTLYIDTDSCIDGVTDIIDEKVLLILSTSFSPKLVLVIHDIVQLYSIYVLTNDNVENQSWTNEFKKVQFVSNSIDNLCQVLKTDVEKCYDDFVPISYIPSDRCTPQNLNELPATFMYSQMLKEILSDIGDHPNAKEDLVHYWYQQYNTNENQLKKINEFDQMYCPKSAIKWYSREPFVYSLLNRALRTLDIDVFIKMGFFLRDLDQQITRTYEKQSKNLIPSIVYRGQGMNKDEFEKLRQYSNGLLSFNNFISTSVDSHVAEMFLPNPTLDLTITAILFKIEIDPMITSTPFVLLNEQTNFPEEQEILFSMHSVFRVIQIVEIKKDFWQVNLKLTNDNDEDLIKLTNYMREEIEGGTGWHRLGLLLIKIGNFTKAEEIYEILLQKTHPLDIQTRACLLHQLGLVHHYKGNFHKALKLYTKKLIIEELNPFDNFTQLATTYSNIAAVHCSMGQYSEALNFYKKTLEIEETYLPSNSPELATTYSNIGLVYRSKGNYQQAIEMYSKALKIGEKSLPANHPNFIFMHNNIASVCYHLDDYPNALRHHKQALDIEQRSLPSNHPYLALTYSYIGLIYKKMESFTTAMDFYQKALDIYESSSQSEHPNLASIYSNIGSIHHTRKQYDSALKFYFRTLTIEQKFYGLFHPEVGATYRNIAATYDSKGEHQRALECYEKVQNIYRISLPPDHLEFALLYNNMGVAHYHMQNNAQALSLFKRALSIYKIYLPPNHHLRHDCEENITRLQNTSTTPCSLF